MGDVAKEGSMGAALRAITSIGVVGTLAGGAIALAQVPGIQNTSATGDAGNSATATEGLRSLLDQSAKLHAAIDAARASIAEGSATADDESSSASAPAKESALESVHSHPKPSRSPQVAGTQDAAPTKADRDDPPGSTAEAAADPTSAPSADPSDGDDQPVQVAPRPAVTPIPITPTSVPSETPTFTRSPRPSPTWTRTRQPGGGDD
jgi:hypothetical protein